MASENGTAKTDRRLVAILAADIAGYSALMGPFEAGRQLAAGIPGAHFIALPGQNHLFLEDEPASERFFEETKLFLSR